MDIPEIAITSPTAPGVTHRWTNMTAFTEEIANARIWAGFHYRFSTRVGTEWGFRSVNSCENVMQPRNGFTMTSDPRCAHGPRLMRDAQEKLILARAARSWPLSRTQLNLRGRVARA